MVTVSDVVKLIRGIGYNYNEDITSVWIAPECEEWTHVCFPINSGLLDLLGDVIVETIDVEGEYIRMWIKTTDFNVPKLQSEVTT